jgi:hypothetical protein
MAIDRELLKRLGAKRLEHLERGALANAEVWSLSEGYGAPVIYNAPPNAFDYLDGDTSSEADILPFLEIAVLHVPTIDPTRLRRVLLKEADRRSRDERWREARPKEDHHG